MGGGHIFKSVVYKIRLGIKYFAMTVDKASKLEKNLIRLFSAGAQYLF